MKYTRIISLILSAAICLAQIPMQAFAAEESSQFTIEASTTEPITVTGQSGEAQAKGTYLTLSYPEGQEIQRDYDQTVVVQVTNNGEGTFLYYLECDNPYEDLSMNFVREGAKGAPMLIGPHETQEVKLSVFAQNAEQTDYTVPVRAFRVSEDSDGEMDALLNLAFQCEAADGIVSITPAGEPDENSLATAYTVTNVGASDITDLSLTIDGEAASYMQIVPGVENYPLEAGESLTVELVPDLAKMAREDKTVLTGSIVPTGGVSQVQSGQAPAARARAVTAQAVETLEASAGVPISVNTSGKEIKTISSADLALYQAGNEFYDAVYDPSKFRVTSTVGGVTYDMAEVTAWYWDESDPSKNGVDTAEELQEVLDTLIDEATGEINYTVESAFQYTDSDGSQQEVDITVETVIKPAEEENSSRQAQELQTEMYYDDAVDEMTMRNTSYLQGEDVSASLQEAVTGAAGELNIKDFSIDILPEQLNKPQVLETVVTIGNAGLEFLQNMETYRPNANLLLNGSLSESDRALMDRAMRRVQNVGLVTAPAKMLTLTNDLMETAGDVMKTADVWNNPNASQEVKVGYTSLVVAKNINTYFLGSALSSVGAVIGTAAADGVGAVIGFLLGVGISESLNKVLEACLEGYDMILGNEDPWTAVLKYWIMGIQCTNRGSITSEFYLPEMNTSSGGDGEEGLPGAMYMGTDVYLSSRLSDGRPASYFYYDEEFGGDTYRHDRELTSYYYLNGKRVGTSQDHGLSQIAFADLSEGAGESLQSGKNTVTRDYDTDPGHYTAKTDTEVTIIYAGNWDIGYLKDTPDGLQDVRSLPDFAVYKENMQLEKTAIIGERNQVEILAYNTGSAGGWVNISVTDEEGHSLYQEENVYIAPFSSHPIQFEWSPSQEKHQLTVNLSMPETSVDGTMELDTTEYNYKNNSATLEVEARHRAVPQFASELPENLSFLEIAYPEVELLNAADVKSVTIQVGSQLQEADCSSYQHRLVNGEHIDIVKAHAAFDNLSRGDYTVTVTATYYVTNEDGTRGTAAITQSKTVHFDELAGIEFRVDTRSVSISTLMAIYDDGSGQWRPMPGITIYRYLEGNATTRCKLAYDPYVYTDLEGCYILTRYGGSGSGLAMLPLAELDGQLLTTNTEDALNITLDVAEDEEVVLNYLSEINGKPLYDPRKISVPISSTGNLRIAGIDSIHLQPLVRSEKIGGQAYLDIPISAENGNTYQLSDYYHLRSQVLEDVTNGNVLQGVPLRAVYADGSTRTGTAVRSFDRSSHTLTMMIPFPEENCTELYAGFYYFDNADMQDPENENYFQLVNLMEEPGPLRKEDCAEITFLCSGGMRPSMNEFFITVSSHGVTMTTTEQYKFNKHKLCLGMGDYDVTVQYWNEESQRVVQYHTQINVQDTSPQTITLPSETSGEAVQTLAASGVFAAMARTQPVTFTWPAHFSNASLRALTGEGWGAITPLTSGQPVSLPGDAQQFQLILSGSGSTAAVQGDLPEDSSIAVGGHFTGRLTTASASCAAGETVHLELAELLDANGMELTEYNAQTSQGVLSGTLRVSGEGQEFTQEVSLWDLSEGVDLSFPADTQPGTYTCSLSIHGNPVTVDPDPDNPDTPDPEEPDNPDPDNPDPDNPEEPDNPDTPDPEDPDNPDPDNPDPDNPDPDNPDAPDPEDPDNPDTGDSTGWRLPFGVLAFMGSATLLYAVRKQRRTDEEDTDSRVS